ncbi:MAG: hypothetical protein Kow00109_14180 [Acidobacteriota bacterium]
MDLRGLRRPAIELIPRLAGRRIAVIGDLILDRFVWGEVRRISPEAPVPVVEVVRESQRPGGAANVAMNLRSLGAEVELVGLVGRDREADELRLLLNQAGVSSRFVIADTERPTTTKTRIIAHHQQVCRCDRESRHAVPAETARDLQAAAVAAVEPAEAVIISDYAKGVVNPPLLAAVTDRARARNIPVATDPKRRDVSVYRNSTAITPNRREAEEATGLELTDATAIAEAAKRIREAVGAAYVLITRGEEGMSLLVGDRLEHFPAQAREVFDVTGAGDTVIAAFTLALAGGASAELAAYLANLAAGIVVGKLGTAAATPAELLAALATLSGE